MIRDELARTSEDNRTTYYTMSIWLGAYLLERGCKLMRTEILPNGKARWQFERHPAYELAQTFYRVPDEAVTNGPAFIDCYHELVRGADAARELLA